MRGGFGHAPKAIEQGSVNRSHCFRGHGPRLQFVAHPLGDIQGAFPVFVLHAAVYPASTAAAIASVIVWSSADVRPLTPIAPSSFPVAFLSGEPPGIAVRSGSQK